MYHTFNAYIFHGRGSRIQELSVQPVLLAFHIIIIIYADLPNYLCRCVNTGDHLCPDILLPTADNILYIIELTVGFETNLNNNANRKELRYRSLREDLAKDFNKIKFFNLSVSYLGN